jgi:hypothetical protein
MRKLKRYQVALVIVTVAILSVSLMSYFASAYFAQHTYSPTQDPTSISSIPASTIDSIASQIESNPQFIAEENGWNYNCSSWSGRGVLYHNGTSVVGDFMFYFDNHTGVLWHPGCAGATIILQSLLPKFKSSRTRVEACNR